MISIRVSHWIAGSSRIEWDWIETELGGGTTSLLFLRSELDRSSDNAGIPYLCIGLEVVGED